MAEIKHQIPINATPEKVYPALASQTGLCNCWTVDTLHRERQSQSAVDSIGQREGGAWPAAEFNGILAKSPIIMEMKPFWERPS